MKRAMQEVQPQWIKEKPIFSWDHPSSSEGIHNYDKFYGISSNGNERHYGYLEVAKEKIFVQMYAPNQIKINDETVLLLHGYMDHSATSVALINHLLKNGYRVITFDWQGHGLSSGSRYNIPSFHEYLQVLEKIANQVLEKIGPKALHIVAHSTGAAVTMDGLLRGHLRVNQVVLTAPLYTIPFGLLAERVFPLVQPIRSEIKRVYRKHSSDPIFLKKMKEDPLQHHTLPINWFSSLVKWKKEVNMKEAKKTKGITVLQGTKDTTVHWKENLRWIKKKFPNSDLLLIDEGRHHLWNERQGIREIVFSQIIKGLQTETCMSGSLSRTDENEFVKQC
ncbi:alpha/beta hydrolase [Halalkalibacterium ligniniphilum]|uniref:alpha/beta hydrolase n=1 Tax=Halalkalibacterium ligniniphilum TaxID=1134413 RepID=UPI00034A544B|nr:alpha/beta hydrolase [Halalkalibacterium ligniniphilum]